METTGATDHEAVVPTGPLCFIYFNVIDYDQKNWMKTQAAHSTTRLISSRYQAVTNAVKYSQAQMSKSRKRVYIYLILVWGTASVVGMPIILGLNNSAPERYTIINSLVIRVVQLYLQDKGWTFPDEVESCETKYQSVMSSNGQIHSISCNWK